MCMHACVHTSIQFSNFPCQYVSAHSYFSLMCRPSIKAHSVLSIRADKCVGMCNTFDEYAF